MIMRKTLALAALLAATAFTPALAQEELRQGRRMATAEEPTPLSMQADVQVAQRGRGERGARNYGDARPNGNGGQGRADGGWERPQRAARVTPAPVQVQQAPPAPRQWNGGNNVGQRNWQGQRRPDWSTGAQDGQINQRQAPPVAVAPAQPQGNWQNRAQRRDTWRSNGNGNGGGGVTQRQGDRRWNGNNSWNGENRFGGQAGDGRRNGIWRTDGRDDQQWNGNGRDDTWRNTGRNDARNGRRYDQRSQWQNQYRNWNRNWTRDWRRDQRYDWQRYRYSNRGLFQGNRYYAPYGWDYGYRRFSIGFSLSYLLYGQQYWIDDPYNYRLPPVYGPYRWVRYYDDVLLVDLRSGQIVDAVYDFFWS